MDMADTFALQSQSLESSDQNGIVLGGMDTDTRNAKMSFSLLLILLDQRKFGHIAESNITSGRRRPAKPTASDVLLGDDFVLRRANKDGKDYHLLDNENSAPLATLELIEGAIHSKYP